MLHPLQTRVGSHKQSFPNMCRLQNTSFLNTTISSMTITATTRNMMHMISRLCRCLFSAFTSCPTPSSTCKAPCCRCYLDEASPSPAQGRKPTTAAIRLCTGNPAHYVQLSSIAACSRNWHTYSVSDSANAAVEIVEPEVDDAKQRGQGRRAKGKPPTLRETCSML